METDWSLRNLASMRGPARLSVTEYAHTPQTLATERIEISTGYDTIRHGKAQYGRIEYVRLHLLVFLLSCEPIRAVFSPFSFIDSEVFFSNIHEERNKMEW